ncbi:ankyrin-2-like [Selaginella moellendorffii]|uniref:ankyrin-2-like n=1 Tax=Selaginella moellendorffii TaxID=88036 RepID=UPI000D1C2AA7|nr:ankyrin-2-like [Selaginella moellendorffii]|eukprot:XP_024527537.1 ankyrin-2-like [Selaginella moellendorffii]
MVEGAPSSKTVADATTALSAREAVGDLLNASLTGTLEEFQDAAKKMAQGQEAIVDVIAAVKDANGRGPLHFAARGGNLQVCKELVENFHLEVDQKDNDGETPLIHAARLGHFDTAKFLIEHNAQVSMSSLDLGSTPLHHAAGIGSIELMRLFLDNGAKINTESTSGTPLVWAAGHGNTEAVKLLLGSGANPNILAENGVSALISGAATGSYDVVSLLIRHGADVNISASGVTALHVAADTGDEKMVKCLLDAGADPNAQDEDGAKPIQAAAARNSRSIVQMLLPLTSQDAKDNEWSVDDLIAREAPQRTTEISQEMLDKASEAKSRGTEAFNRKDYLIAIDAYTQALDINPTDASLYSNRSVCWIRTGQAEQALKDAKAAVDLRPDWAKARYREGVALRLLERYEEAATAFYDGINLEPNNKELQEAFRLAVETGKKHHANNQKTM